MFLYLYNREQLLRMLCALTRDNFQPALEECRNPQHRLNAVLDEVLYKLRSSEDNQDEIDMCCELLGKLFPVFIPIPPIVKHYSSIF